MGDVMRSAAQPARSNSEEVQMEARIARLESDVAHIDGLRDKVEAGFTDIRQSIAQLSVAIEKAYGKSKVETIGTRVWALGTLGGILLIMARAFKWI
jgi:uncharacterized coiled-coil protein SlyX